MTVLYATFILLSINLSNPFLLAFSILALIVARFWFMWFAEYALDKREEILSIFYTYWR